MGFMHALLIFIPVAVLAEFLHWSPAVVLVCSCFGLAPLAGFMGEATESL